MDSNQWPVVERFLRSGLAETVIQQTVSAHALRRAQAAGMTPIDNTFTLHLIKVVLSTGQTEVLATSLIDAQGYPAEAFADLYHSRWHIEEVST